MILVPPSQPPFPSGKVTDFTCLLSCGFSSSFLPPPHSPTSPLKKRPGQGRPRVFPSLLAASRPQPGEHPDGRADAGVGAGRRAASGQGCREEVPARSGGVGGPSGSEGSEQGAAALRAGGSQHRVGGGHGRSRGGEVPGRTGSEVPAAGVPGRGLSGCTLHWATPAPSLSTLGSLGWDQALSSQSAAALEPEPGAVNQVRGGWGRGVGAAWLVGCFLLPSSPRAAPTPCLP